VEAYATLKVKSCELGVPFRLFYVLGSLKGTGTIADLTFRTSSLNPRIRIPAQKIKDKRAQSQRILGQNESGIHKRSESKFLFET
jgi:hypothetical protein